MELLLSHYKKALGSKKGKEWVYILLLGLVIAWTTVLTEASSLPGFAAGELGQAECCVFQPDGIL